MTLKHRIKEAVLILPWALFILHGGKLKHVTIGEIYFKNRRNTGAAKSCITYLLDNGIEKIYLVSRKKDSSKKYDDRVDLISYDELKGITGDILINTTPVGMYPNVGTSPVGENIIKNFNALVDLIYNPRETEFLKLGKIQGKKTCGGLYMLVGQAMKSQEIWQDKKVTREVIDSIYNKLDKQFK